MKFPEQQFANLLVLDLSGKIDHDSADAFRDALIPHVEAQAVDYQMIVLDMSDVEYMSSVGLRALVLAAKKSKTAARPIAVAGLNETMREIFQISRFDLIFDVYDDVRAAISELSATALAVYPAAPQGG